MIFYVANKLAVHFDGVSNSKPAPSPFFPIHVPSDDKGSVDEKGAIARFG